MRMILVIILTFLSLTAVAPTKDTGRDIAIGELMVRLKAYDLGVQVRESLSDVSVRLDLPPEHLLHMESMRVKYGIPFNLFYRLVWYENRFMHGRSSPKGAVGYMQVMPSTFRWIAGRIDVRCVHDPFDNIEAGAFYLSHQRGRMDDYEEDLAWIMAVAAYNAGFSRHRRALIHYRETRDYVAFVF